MVENAGSWHCGQNPVAEVQDPGGKWFIAFTFQLSTVTGSRRTYAGHNRRRLCYVSRVDLRQPDSNFDLGVLVAGHCHLSCRGEAASGPVWQPGCGGWTRGI